MHREELQVADTSFRTHEQLNIFKQPDSQSFYEQHLLLTVENIIKYTEDIQQEHRFRKSNTLTAK